MTAATSGRVAIFCDASLCRDKVGTAGIGISFRDDQGEFCAFRTPVEIWPEMFALGRQVLIDVLEYLGVIIAIELCRDFGITDADICCDNDNVVREVSGLPWRSYSRTLVLGSIVRQLIYVPGVNIHIHPIAREENVRADDLSQRARSLTCESIEWRRHPTRTWWPCAWRHYVRGEYDLPTEASA